MLNFNNIGCQVGQDSLKLKLEMAKKTKDIDNVIQQKKDKATNERKRKHDEVQNKIDNGLPLDQLSVTQLKSLCLHKKRKDDKVSISKLKRDELLSLWLNWKSRPDPVNVSMSRDHTSHVEVDIDKEYRHNVNCDENTTIDNPVLL